ncbi:MAG: hypothetical protein A2261_02450 [Candidatus Magasanikbacteria bacterium RIFOXYA2_FULL_44_8]|uniref:Glycosyltransferase 2-like domain-containing protein n=1 Tax=Candidatus Magasanikbacteria bacterium RIFOXYA2_FULL_44_8 TaxID=1798696 RepID=A0A1F6NL28_9BACT|nr:MAG: hypothetical protein A2261_02450 [Candidatus Magasanikbacteria bacterium RIFOXYA2_FULL_44_8]
MPLISVIIPAYNHAHILKKCILSLVGQTYRPLEIIIINDGSTDNFVTVMIDVEKILRAHDFSYKIINQTNAGAPAARNRGFGESTGEYVIFCDADIVACPGMLKKMYDALQNNPTVSYAYSQFRFGWKKFKAQAFDSEALKKNNYINTVTLIRRTALTEISTQGGPWDESLARLQDWDLFLTLLQHHKTGILMPEILYRAQVGGRIGISSWLPSFMYRLPWKTKAVKNFEAARDIIARKHGLKF